MTARDHNRLLAKGRKRALRLEPELAKILRAIFDEATVEAVRNFERTAPHPTVTAAAPTSASAMVAVYPLPDEQAALAQPDGEPVDIIHCTLAFLGEIDDPTLERVVQAMREVALEHAPRDGWVGGLGYFAPAADSDALWPVLALPDVPGLPELRHAVVKALDTAGVPFAQNHGWLPHITLAYAETEAEALAALPGALAGQPVTFRFLTVTRGDVPTHIGLTSGTVVAAAPPPDWRPPRPGELVDVDALAKRLLERSAPARAAVVESLMGPSLQGVGVAFDVTNPLIAKALNSTGRHIVDIAQETRSGVARAVDAAYREGLSIPNTARLIQSQMSEAADRRATLIARTEMTTATASASLSTTSIVSDVTGVTFRKVWLCLPPDARVTAAGVTAAVKKPYEGDLVEITARPSGGASGAAPPLRRFSVTPDHLVLTRAGWLPAGEVKEGDEVVGRSLSDGDAPSAPDVDDVEPTIEEVFNTATQRLAAVGMVSTPVYLDGGAVGEQVDVVAAYRGLSDGVDIAVTEPLREFILAYSDVGLDRLLRGGASRDLAFGEWTAKVEGGRQRAALGQDARVAEMAHAVGLDFGSQAPAVLANDLLNEPVRDPEATAESFGGESGLVQFDEVVGVQRRPFSGHVYDLTTLSGWLFADGYVAHNTAPGAEYPRHEEYDGLDGQTRALDGLFDVGGYELEYPGDQAGPVEEVANCRCTLEYTEG